MGLKLAGNVVRLALCALVALCGGCQRYFIDGGRPYHVRDGMEVLVRYRAEGPSPPGVTFSLVRTRHGIGVFEQNADGSGSLTLTTWQADGNDHYAIWIKRGPAFEYVVPVDRTKAAQRLVYPNGMYEIEEIADVDRPIPHGSVGQAMALIPEIAGAVAPAPQPVPAAAPALPAGCTADTDCRHGRACRRGACTAETTRR
jgi:hypothetical protein